MKAKFSDPAFRTNLLFAAILLIIALVPRLIGVNWHGSNPDEDVSGPARLLAGDLHPHAYFYPPLLTYLSAVAYMPLFVIGRVLGLWHSASDFRAAYFADPTPFFVACRIVTAICSAFAAPIAFALAREVRLSLRFAILVGLAVALSSGAIYWAHIAKSDSGLATAFLLVALTGLRMADRPGGIIRAILFGFALALSISFKQSGLFFAGPFALAVFLWSMRTPASRMKMFVTWVWAGIAFVVAALILNFGVLLEFQAFVEAQKVQALMSIRKTTAQETLHQFYLALSSPEAGLPLTTLLVMIVVTLLGAVLAGQTIQRLLLAMLIFASCVGGAAILAVTGDRQPPHLWLPYIVVACTIFAIASAMLIETGPRWGAVVGGLALAILFVSDVARTVPVLQQALRPAVAQQVATIILQKVPKGSRVAGDISGLYVPLAVESLTIPRARHERLAKQYGIVLPPPERPYTGVAGGYVAINYPFVMGGLEAYKKEDVKVVAPYAWPMQPEEWTLKWWFDQGFHYFLVDNPAWADHPVRTYRDFFQSIRRCQLLAVIPNDRPLFFEHENRLYRCS